MDITTYVILFAVSLVAGCFDAIAGGGGLLTLPAMMLAGLSPVTAIATNKMQSSAAAVSATYAFARKGLIGWKSGLPIALAAAVAAVLGALSVNLLPKSVVSAVIPFVLIGIAIYFGMARKLGDADAKARVSRTTFLLAVAPAIGFYEGIFGPGAGSFYMAAYVALLGYGAIKATAHTKLTNAAGSLGALGLFAFTGSIDWVVGLVMAAGAFAGAQIGSIMAMRVGAKLIRPLLVTISCLMALRLLLDPTNSIYQIFR
ncbi:TSUP family transporter [Rhizobium lemnae]|uniref:Probable membrane transporter protein n=1 Tax=Rhizobium lemnae TaxID=1214924 RepID=A0ABV8EDL6_9HYPH|nr:TSUP family transporter [Rhizobium lemnae]MCJ8507856.1 TSUP family transporter [Rhizobium lemnae]